MSNWKRAAKRLQDEHGLDIRTSADNQEATDLFSDLLAEEMGIKAMRVERAQRLNAPKRLQTVKALESGNPDRERIVRAKNDLHTMDLSGTSEELRNVMQAYAEKTGRDFHWNDDVLGEEQ